MLIAGLGYLQKQCVCSYRRSLSSRKSSKSRQGDVEQLARWVIAGQ